jgi:DNA-binding response OmpR family regulator
MSAPTGQRTILIIDDDPDYRNPLAHVLGAAGYRVRCACDGAQGLAMASEEPPDLILLDFIMPSKDGLEVAHEIRQQTALQRVPIIALTAFGRDIGKIHGLPHDEALASIHDFLDKPVDPNVLLDRIAGAIATR